MSTPISSPPIRDMTPPARQNTAVVTPMTRPAQRDGNQRARRDAGEQIEQFGNGAIGSGLAAGQHRGGNDAAHAAAVDGEHVTVSPGAASAGQSAPAASGSTPRRGRCSWRSACAN
jgi:hypothetical protein